MIHDGQDTAIDNAPRLNERRKRGPKLLVSIPVIVLALVGSMITSTGPAAASVPGLVRIAATSPSNSADNKGVTATCPTGKRLVGVGGRIGGGSGEVVMDDVRPNGSSTTAPTSVRVYAYETDSHAGNWTVTALAVCANPLPGLVRIAATGVSDSLNVKGVTAYCPAGKQLLGTGAEITGGLGEVLISSINPNGSSTVAPTAVRANADEESSYSSSWYVTAYAICANPLAGLSRVSVTSQWDSLDSKGVIARCPIGKNLLGTGGGLVWGNDDVGSNGFGDVVFQAFAPNGSDTSAPRSVNVTLYEEDATTSDWAVRAEAICAAA